MQSRRRSNPYRIEGDTVILELTRGQTTMIDMRDFDLVRRYTWIANPHKADGYYAMAGARTPEGRQTTIQLHRLLFGNPHRTIEIDHINHNTLDNRRANLRTVTHAQNMQNRKGPTKIGKSGIRGVTEHHVKGITYWKSFVWLNNKPRACKYFPYTEEGKKQAALWVIEKRLELMTHSGDQ